MIKLRKYLKPHLLALFLAIALLFVQSYSDLKLPNYMSQIVNVGIQQSGIEHATPEAISTKGHTLVGLLLEGDEKALWNQSYTLVTAGTTKYEGEYPLVKTEDIYVLNDVSSATLSTLDVATGKAVWTLINLAEAQQGSSGSGAISTQEIKLEELYTMIPVLTVLPQSVLDSAQAKAAAMDESTLKQTGLVFTKAFYTENGMNVDTIQMKFVITAGFKMIGMTLLGTLATVLVVLLAARIGAAVARMLRADIFKKVMNFSNTEFDKYSSSSLITRTTNDITQVQQVVTFGIRLIFYAPIIGIGGIMMIQQDNNSMTWIIAVAVAALIAVILVIFFVAFPKFKITQKLIDKVNLVARESLTGIMVVRAFGTQDFERKRFDDANKDLSSVLLFVSVISATMMPIMMLIMNFTTLLIVWVGAHQIADASMQIGSMMAFIQYTMQIIFAFLMIAMIFIMIPRASVSANRISEVLETENSILDPVNPVHEDPSKKGYVEFDHVSFRYEGAQDDVLSDISFVASPGETTAFIGSTGSGKSTLVNLIPRFYDVSGGSIKVGGIDIRDLAQHELRDGIGYIPQKGMLLSGTIRSNLVYGKPDATDDEIEEAIEISQASDFISKKEDGIDSNIAQGGANVSGGQKQRLSIARALVKKAPVVIFDDSFSALDFKTDRALREALDDRMNTTTVLVVAQRVNTIMGAHQIIVLDEGRIVGKGTHHELLKSCPTYYEIASSQLSQEELAHE